MKSLAPVDSAAAESASGRIEALVRDALHRWRCRTRPNRRLGEKGDWGVGSRRAP